MTKKLARIGYQLCTSKKINLGMALDHSNDNSLRQTVKQELLNAFFVSALAIPTSSRTVKGVTLWIGPWAFRIKILNETKIFNLHP